MDQEGLSLESEVVSVLEHASAGMNFVLSGGAGSGKTYSLVQVIGGLLQTYPAVTIACVTYTNAAVHEIRSRVDNKRLRVSTIHDFLWDAIGSFQSELKTVLLRSLEGETPVIKPGSVVVVPNLFEGKAIQYKEYKRLADGIVSHDEVIILARAMFEKYPKLRDIIRDRFSFILVDEYQDTAPEVVDILLEFLPQSSRFGVAGFFGDAMQAIYDDGIGDIRGWINRGQVVEVKKEQNRRNPRLVYELANELRNDGIVQRPSEDASAPNMRNGIVKDGTVHFYYTLGAHPDVNAVRAHLGWDFSDVAQTKELNLTHNLIAPQAGFGDLMAIYDKDGVIQFRDRIVEYLKKKNLLLDYDGLTFGEVLDALQNGQTGSELKAVSPTQSMQAFINVNPRLFTDAKSRNFLELRRMFLKKELLIDDKKQSEEDMARKGSNRCEFIKHVFRIQEVAHLYSSGKYNEFLRKTEFKLARASDKKVLKNYLEKIEGMANQPVIEVIEFAHTVGLCKKDDRLEDFIYRKPYLFERVKQVPYSSYQALYNYLEGRTGFSTQHKIKGLEFDRVLVVMNSGDWSKYNFGYLFEGTGNPTVLERTRKLFYVCCTRAKDSLAVYYHQPSEAVLTQAREWFGPENCKAL